MFENIALDIVLGIAALIVALLAVILIRAALFKPKGEKKEEVFEEVNFDKDAAVKTLQELIRCKTVSRYSHDLEDDAEFEKLIGMLPTLFPHVFETMTFERLEDRGILFHWKGKEDGDPAVLMAHYDVVPVDTPEDWENPPFEGLIKDGVLWGRGTLDTKVTFSSALFAAETLLKEGFTPKNDIWFAFSGGEEVNGPGAIHIRDYLVGKGVKPAMIVDEGGAVVDNVFPGVHEPCALIGIAEKGMMDVEYKVKSNGGHASAPKPHTPVGVLASACEKVENNPFHFSMTTPVAGMFDVLGRRSTFVYRMIFANLWCFKPVLNAICKKSGGEINAMLRTTVAFTQMKGSDASNVIPPQATMVSNIRLNPADTMDSAVEYLKKTIKDENVELRVIQGMNPSAISETDCDGYRRVANAVRGTWKGTVVSPYLMVQCSDSRHWSEVSDRVYRFSAMDLAGEERATIHGTNERIRLDAIARATEFYIRLEKQC